MKTVQDIQSSIAADRSKKNIDRIANFLKTKPELLKQSMVLVDGDLNVAMRYTWMLGHLSEQAPSLVFPYVSALFTKRHTHPIKGFHRSLCKIMTSTGVPAEIEGDVVDQIFKWCLDPKTDVAVKVYGITVVAKLCEKYPDLERELRQVIEDQYQLNSVAFKARSNKIMKQLDKKNPDLNKPGF